jgi:hypothetical protein
LGDRGEVRACQCPSLAFMLPEEPLIQRMSV